MAVIKDGTTNAVAKVDANGSMRFVMVDASGTAAGLSISGTVEVANDVGNPLPVSGSVSIANFPGTQAVSGTFWQATQPVSVAALPALSAGSAIIGAVTQGPAGAQAWPVSLAALPALAAGSNTIGKVDQGAAGANAWPVSLAALPALPAGANNIGSVSQAGAPWSVNIANFPATTEISNDTGNPIPVVVSGRGNQADNGIFTTDTYQGQVTGFFNPPPVQLFVGAGVPVLAANPLPVYNPQITLAVTAVGAAGAALVATLPPVVNQCHLISKVEIQLFSSATVAGAATPVTVTSTNLPGNVSWTLGSARTIGTVDRVVADFNANLRSVNFNTATTINCPAVTSGLWRVTIYYFAAP